MYIQQLLYQNILNIMCIIWYSTKFNKGTRAIYNHSSKQEEHTQAIQDFDTQKH